MPQLFSAGAALVTRGLGSVLQFGLTVLFSRLLGASGIGVFYLYISWTNLLGTVASLGLPLYTLRGVSSLLAQGRSSRARALTLSALKTVISAGFLLAFLTVIVSNGIAEPLLGSRSYSFVLRVAGFAAAGLAALRVLAEALKAQGKANLGLSVEFNAPPCTLLLLVAVVAFAGYSLTSNMAALLHGLGIAFVALATYAFFIHQWGYQPGTGDPLGPLPLRPLIALWGISLLNTAIAASPYLVLPQFASPEEIGQFGVAHRLIALSATILFALASIFGPKFAQQHAMNHQASLKRSFRLSQVYSLTSYLPFLLAFTVFADEVLSIFGPEFPEARQLLWVLAFGRLIHSAAGLTEYVLNMTGREMWELLSAFVSVVSFLIASVPLGSAYGALGVAWAYAAAFAIRSVFSLSLVYISFKLQPRPV